MVLLKTPISKKMQLLLKLYLVQALLDKLNNDACIASVLIRHLCQMTYDNFVVGS